MVKYVYPSKLNLETKRHISCVSTDSPGKMARGLGVRLPPRWIFKASTTPARQIGPFAKGDQLQSQQCGCGDEKLERGRCNQRKAAYVRQRGQGSEGDDASAHRGFLIQNTLQCVPLFVDKEGPAKRLWSDAQSDHISVAALWGGARRTTQQMCAWSIAQKRCALADWHSSTKAIAALLIAHVTQRRLCSRRQCETQLRI